MRRFNLISFLSFVFVCAGCNCGPVPVVDCTKHACHVDASVPEVPDAGSIEACPKVDRDQAAGSIASVFGVQKSVVEALGSGPSDSVSRSEVVGWVSTLIRATEIYSAKPERPSFGDVPSDSSGFRSIEALVMMGVVECDPDLRYKQENRFRPADPSDRCFIDGLVQRIDPILSRPHIVMVESSLGGLVPQGARHQNLATYLMFGETREKPVSGLRIMNDLQGEFDAPEMPQVVSAVYLSCGKAEMMTGNFSLGVVDLPPFQPSAVGCVREDRLPVEMVLAFDTWEQANFIPSTSGFQFRLGLVGSVFPVERQVTYTYTYRKTMPIFRRANGVSETLVEGENILYPLEACADEHGDFGTARLSFVAAFQSQAGRCESVRLVRSGVVVARASQPNLDPGMMIPISVPFEIEEKVAAGGCARFDLVASCYGFASDEELGSTLWAGDEDWVYAKPKTGCIFDPDDAMACLLDSSDKFFSQVPKGFGILWSDLSASQHQYPGISNGQFVSRGSSDFTTGLGLWIGERPEIGWHVLKK